MTTEYFRQLFLEANRKRKIPMDEFAAQEISRLEGLLRAAGEDLLENYPVEGAPV